MISKIRNERQIEEATQINSAAQKTKELGEKVEDSEPGKRMPETSGDQLLTKDEEIAKLRDLV